MREWNNDNERRSSTGRWNQDPTYDYFITLTSNQRGTHQDALRACASLLDVLDHQVFCFRPSRGLRRVVALEQDPASRSYIHIMLESPERANPGHMSEHEFSELIRYAWQRLAGLDWAEEDEVDGGVQRFVSVTPEEAADIVNAKIGARTAEIQWELTNTVEEADFVPDTGLWMHPAKRKEEAADSAP